MSTHGYQLQALRTFGTCFVDVWVADARGTAIGGPFHAQWSLQAHGPQELRLNLHLIGPEPRVPIPRGAVLPIELQVYDLLASLPVRAYGGDSLTLHRELLKSSLTGA